MVSMAESIVRLNTYVRTAEVPAVISGKLVDFIIFSIGIFRQRDFQVLRGNVNTVQVRLETVQLYMWLLQISTGI